MGRLEPASKTDMSAFEGALGYHWCHIMTGKRGVALCGAPRTDRRLHEGSWDTEVCDGCGRRNCPDCQRVAWGMDL